MFKKNVIYVLIVMVLMVSIVIYFLKNDAPRPLVIGNNIEDIHLQTDKSNRNFFLFYPRDPRVSQGYTYIKEVNKHGETVKTYRVNDKQFKRFNIQQKPSDFNQLFLSLFGEAVIDNIFYTYDIASEKFNKINIDYFKFPLGVSSMEHYGSDVLIKNIVSHKTGTQNYDEKTNEINISISNLTKQISFETGYNELPSDAPLLSFNDRIIYLTTPELLSDYSYSKERIAIVDLKKQKATYHTYPNTNNYYPLYATKKYAYVLTDTGKMLVYDKKFNAEETFPFEKLPRQDVYFRGSSNFLAVKDDEMLYTTFTEKQGTVVGILKFSGNPSFEPLNKKHLPNNADYRFLYQNMQKGEIYLIKTIGEQDYVVIMENKDYNLVAEFPVEKGYLLDFVK